MVKHGGRMLSSRQKPGPTGQRDEVQQKTHHTIAIACTVSEIERIPQYLGFKSDPKTFVLTL